MATQREETLEARLRDLAVPFADELGVELVDVEVKGHPGSRVVRLVVDADGGVDVETCADLSRRAGQAFDDADAVPGRYTLQVSSPGADRPLRSARDFARNLGRPVRLVPRPETALPAEIVGVVAEVADDAVTIGSGDGALRVPLADVEHARVQLPW